MCSCFKKTRLPHVLSNFRTWNALVVLFSDISVLPRPWRYLVSTQVALILLPYRVGELSLWRFRIVLAWPGLSYSFCMTVHSAKLWFQAKDVLRSLLNLRWNLILPRSRSGL